MQYEVLTLINHGGTLYAPGAVINLSSEEAEKFKGTGEIAPVDVPFGKKVSAQFALHVTPAPLVETDMSFAFELGERVVLIGSLFAGEVRGRAEYVDTESVYFVEIDEPLGVNNSQWMLESNLVRNAPLFAEYSSSAVESPCGL